MAQVAGGGQVYHFTYYLTRGLRVDYAAQMLDFGCAAAYFCGQQQKGLIR